MCELQYGRPAGCLSVQQQARGLRWWAGRGGEGLESHTAHAASQPASYVSCLDTIQERKMPHRAGSALSVVLNINTN